jgi:hypothetical protein
MAINTLNARETISVSGQLADTSTGNNQPAAYGSGPLPLVSTVWVFGTGANAQAPAQIYSDNWYMAQRTVTTITYDNIPLYGSLTNFEGTINFALIKRFDVIIPTPSATTPLLVGPQNQSHAWGGSATPWPGGTGATIYDDCHWWLRNTNPWGWTVTSSPASVLPVYNPNAGSMTYAIWLLGD